MAPQNQRPGLDSFPLNFWQVQKFTSASCKHMKGEHRASKNKDCLLTWWACLGLGVIPDGSSLLPGFASKQIPPACQCLRPRSGQPTSNTWPCSPRWGNRCSAHEGPAYCPPTNNHSQFWFLHQPNCLMKSIICKVLPGRPGCVTKCHQSPDPQAERH